MKIFCKEGFLYQDLSVFFPKTNIFCRASSALVLLSRIVLPGSIDILVSQYISHKIDIIGFSVQCSAVGAAQLMRSYLLQCGYSGGILFHQILHGAH